MRGRTPRDKLCAAMNVPTSMSVPKARSVPKATTRPLAAAKALDCLRQPERYGAAMRRRALNIRPDEPERMTAG
jgi:hypothetical protein